MKNIVFALTVAAVAGLLAAQGQYSGLPPHKDEVQIVEMLPKLAATYNQTADGHIQNLFFCERSKLAADSLKFVPELKEMTGIWLDKATFPDEALVPLAGLKKLASANFTHSTLGDAGLAHLRGLPNMISMNVECPNVTDEGVKHLATITHLYLLRLNGTKLTDAGMGHLAELAGLGHLELDDTAITDEGVAKISGLCKLHTLWLGGTAVTDGVLVHLQKMPLVFLSLRKTAITDSAVASLLEYKNLKGMTNMYLDDTAVTDKTIDYLCQLGPTFRGVSMTHTKITRAGVAKLKAMKLTWYNVDHDLLLDPNAQPSCTPFATTRTAPVHNAPTTRMAK